MLHGEGTKRSLRRGLPQDRVSGNSPMNAFQAQTATGKLNAVITPTTPKGCHCSYIRCRVRSECMVRPYNMRESPRQNPPCRSSPALRRPFGFDLAHFQRHQGTQRVFVLLSTCPIKRMTSPRLGPAPGATRAVVHTTHRRGLGSRRRNNRTHDPIPCHSMDFVTPGLQSPPYRCRPWKAASLLAVPAIRPMRSTVQSLSRSVRAKAVAEAIGQHILEEEILLPDKAAIG